MMEPAHQGAPIGENAPETGIFFSAGHCSRGSVAGLSALLCAASLLLGLGGFAHGEETTVAALVDRALETHPELRFYEAEIDAARGVRRTAGTVDNPELMTGVGNWRVRDLGTGAVGDGPAWAVQLTQRFEWPGRLALRKAIADRQIELAELGVEQFRNTLAAEIKTMGWQMISAQERVRAAAEVSERFTELATVLLQRDPAGAAPRLEARLVEASALTLSAAATQARNQLAQSRFELNQLLGHPAEHPLSLRRVETALKPPPPLERLLTDARQHNFDLRARIIDVQQQGFEVQLAENERWPTISVQPYFQQQANQTNQTRESMAGIGISIPLPLWKRNKGAIETARAKETQAEVMLTAQMRQLERDVASEANHYRLHVEELAKWPGDTLEQFRAAAKEADEHYRLGALPLATYTELQRQYLESVDAVLESQLGAIEALLRLELLTGRKIE